MKSAASPSSGGAAASSASRYMAVAMTELTLQKAAARFLDTVLTKDARWFHCPNGGLRSAKTAALMKAMGVKAGVPDIVLLWDGRTNFIELKHGKGKLSAAQEEFLHWCSINGFPCAICRSLGEIEAALKRMGVPTRLAG